MSAGFWEFLRKSLAGEAPVHPLDRRMAKRWVKERLKRVFPELRNDPAALDRAYAELGLEPIEGAGKGGATVYKITLPGDPESI
ncbi:MAG: hypothetical protein ACOYNG_06795 [Terrimicrobiaceae bacterium]|jgi:hypothetical protein